MIDRHNLAIITEEGVGNVTMREIGKRIRRIAHGRLRHFSKTSTRYFCVVVERKVSGPIGGRYKAIVAQKRDPLEALVRAYVELALANAALIATSFLHAGRRRRSLRSATLTVTVARCQAQDLIPPPGQMAL